SYVPRRFRLVELTSRTNQTIPARELCLWPHTLCVRLHNSLSGSWSEDCLHGLCQHAFRLRKALEFPACAWPSRKTREFHHDVGEQGRADKMKRRAYFFSFSIEREMRLG